jgi:uncharacterized phiE125 gp8 family phage protein
MVRNQSLIRLTAPATEPVTVAEAKDHLELLPSDNHHDAKITRTIQMGRERVENDTSCVLITQTYSLRLRDFPEESKPVHIGLRPVSSITGITYYDDSNSQQTLPSSVYGLDAREQLIYLKYDQEWPSYSSQHNGIQVALTAGYGTAANVPAIFKQLILLQVGMYFEDRGDDYRKRYHNAYDNLLVTAMRRTYP